MVLLSNCPKYLSWLDVTSCIRWLGIRWADASSDRIEFLMAAAKWPTLLQAAFGVEVYSVFYISISSVVPVIRL